MIKRSLLVFISVILFAPLDVLAFNFNNLDSDQLSFKTGQIIVLLFAIIPSPRDAKDILKHLIKKGLTEKGLIAPVTAFIKTDKRIESDKEVILFTMISEKLVESVKKAIQSKCKKYDPCILAIPVIGDYDYVDSHIPNQESEVELDLTDNTK